MCLIALGVRICYDMIHQRQLARFYKPFIDPYRSHAISLFGPYCKNM